MSTQATLARRALDADVLVHALDVAHSGVDAGGQRFDLHLNGVQAAIQGRESLTCPVFIVPEQVCFHHDMETSVHGVTQTVCDEQVYLEW